MTEPRVTPQCIRDIVAAHSGYAGSPSARCLETAALSRQAYVDYLLRRLDAPHAFVEEAIRARSLLV